MTTNAGPEYFAAEKKYREAKTIEQKLFYLREMLKYAPKHKSSEKLLAHITRKIAKLKKEVEKEKTQATRKGSGPTIGVKKEGCGQIVLIGLPNSGKSTLLKELTSVDVAVAPYPFTTTKPEIGMMNYKGALVQIVEVPAIVEGSSEGKANGIQILSIIRNADAIVMVIREEYEEKVLLDELNKANIKVNESKPAIVIKPAKFRGITIAGEKYLKVKKEGLIDFLNNVGIRNANIILNEEADLEKIALVLDDKIVYKRAIVVNTKEKGDVDKLKESIFSLLGKIIIYTKKPGSKVEREEPLVLRKGSTIEDAARVLHKDFAKGLKYARVWGSSKFPGQRVAKDYKLENEDVVEISA